MKDLDLFCAAFNQQNITGLIVLAVKHSDNRSINMDVYETD